MHKIHGERIKNLGTDFFDRSYNHLGSLPKSFSWLDFILIGIIIGLILFCYSPVRNFYFRQNSLSSTWTKIGFLTFAIFFHAIAVQFPSFPGLLIIASVFVVASVAGCRWPQDNEDDKPDEDKLYRKFFASRIAEHLNRTDHLIRRIAVLGPWGSGKSYVLKLIRQELEKSSEQEFRIKWVNPWKASSKEQAIGMLAEAIDQAVDPLAVMKWNWHQSKWLRVITSLLTEKKIGEQFLEAVTGHFPQTGDAFLKKINDQIKRRGIKVVIFVDDMERAEPHIVRAILPVIDCLSELENFYFVFAIDRSQLEFAFGDRVGYPVELGKSNANNNTPAPQTVFQNHESRASIMAQGFLDKVMDLQLTLPDPTPIEIQKWMREKVNKISAACPKLKYAFDRFAQDLLPTNPRICEKFLKEAEQIEVLFLSDYGEHEKNYYALFLAVLADVELPGFRKAFGKYFDEVDKIAGLATTREDLIKSNEFKKTLNNIGSDIGLNIDNSDLKYVRATKILEAMCGLIGIHAIDSKSYGLDLEWICSGYLARLHLPLSKMKEVAKAWKLDGGQRSLPEILEKESRETGYEPAHDEATLFQILEMQLTNIKKKIQSAGNRSRAAEDAYTDIDLAIRNLKPFSMHFDLSRRTLEPVEENLLTPQLAECFMDLIRIAPIKSDESIQWKNLRETIIDAFSTVVSAVPWDKKRTISLDRRQLDSAFITDDEDRSAAQGMLSEVRNRVNRSTINQFIERLKSPAGKQPFWYDQFCPTPILEPNLWIPRSNNEFNLEPLAQIKELSKTSEEALLNIRKIVKDEILEQFVEHLEGYSMSPELLRRMLVDANPTRRNYLGLFWSAAVDNDDGSEILANLLRLREKILQSLDEDSALDDGDNAADETPAPPTETGTNNQNPRTTRRLTRADFEAAFPLPTPSSSDTSPLITTD